MFKTKSIYIGKDMSEFNRIREVLDSNNIKYRHKVTNQMGKWSGTFDGGTLRSRTGSLGVPIEQTYEYEIKVTKEDVDKVRYLLKQ